MMNMENMTNTLKKINKNGGLYILYISKGDMVTSVQAWKCLQKVMLPVSGSPMQVPQTRARYAHYSGFFELDRQRIQQATQFVFDFLSIR